MSEQRSNMDVADEIMQDIEGATTMEGDINMSSRLTISDNAKVITHATSWTVFLQKYPDPPKNFEQIFGEHYTALRQTPLFSGCTNSQMVELLYTSLLFQCSNVTKEQIEEALELFNSQEDTSLPATRGPLITDGLDVDMAHKYDLDAFGHRVDDLFQWHSDEKIAEKYLAPYFPLV